MRRYVIFVVAVIALCGSLTALFATQTWRDFELRGYVDPTQDSNLPYRLEHRLGVNADLFQYSEDELSIQLSLMREAQIVWVRQFIYWDAIEAERGVYDWDAIDRVMRAMDAFPELQLIPVIMQSPVWARDSAVSTAPPDDPHDIVPFLQAFAARYGEQIDYYQIWDEPNLDDAWGLEEPRPADYVALLAEAYGAIHSADADATIIAAALAPTTELAGRNIADDLYLQAMYDYGAAEYFDAVAAKPYGFDSSPLDRNVGRDTLNFSRMVLLREVMVANGDGQAALWASNWGWNSLPDDWSGEASIWGDVTQDEQVRYTLQALDRIEREWAWAGGAILHQWQPSAPDANPQWGFALIDRDNAPTELHQALAAYNWRDAGSNGLYHPRTQYASYSGLWTFSELGADIGWLETSDSQLRFAFYGTDVAIRVREDDYFAFLYPQVDGEMANATPEDADGNAYVLLRSGSQTPEINTVSISRGLPLDTHTLEIVADRGWDRWALAGYAVSSGDLSRPFQRQLQLAWLTLMCAAVATIVSALYLPWGTLYVQSEHWRARLSTGVQFVISVMTSLALMIGMLMSWGAPTPQLLRREMWDATVLIMLTGGLVVLELPVLVVIAAVLVLFWLIYHHLEWGLLLTLFYAPFFLFPVELYTFAFPMAELLLLITFGAWCLRMMVRWGERRQTSVSTFFDKGLRLTAIDWLMVSWLGLACIAVLWSEQRGLALTELRTLFIEPFLFYVMLRSLKLDWQQKERFVWALIGAGVLVCVVGIVLYVRGDAIITAEGGARRLASVYGSPNNVGLLLGRVLPFVLAYGLLCAGRIRLGALLIASLVLVTVALTQSVGAILLGIPAGVVVVIWIVYGRRALPYLVGLLVVGIVGVDILTQVSTRFASLLDLSTGTTFMRIRVWESTIEMLRDYPVTGLGLDQFLYAFSGAYVRPDAIADPDLSHPHNIVLDFWIRLGVAGVVWLGCAGWVVLRRLRDEVVSSAGDSLTKRIIVVGTGGALAAVVAHGLIDNSIYVLDLAYIFALLMVLVAKE